MTQLHYISTRVSWIGVYILKASTLLDTVFAEQNNLLGHSYMLDPLCCERLSCFTIEAVKYTFQIC